MNELHPDQINITKDGDLIPEDGNMTGDLTGMTKEEYEEILKKIENSDPDFKPPYDPSAGDINLNDS